LKDETFQALEGVKRYGGESWFMLGDRDLATHIQRAEGLARGESPSQVTDRLRRALGVTARILPMAEEPCRTMIDTESDGTLPFQQWFVRHRAQPKVRKVWLDGDPPASPAALHALAEAELVIIGPSNPYVSIDPILSRPGLRDALRGRVVIAVSPIIAGRAVKGPLAEMIPALSGQPASAAAIAGHYGSLLSGLVLERGDETAVRGVAVHACDTLMKSREDRVRLGRECLAFANSLREGSSS
ncbi:MAG TPA: 2-phospho-L-lactate transferase CofD family protein, partial [Polyangiaceae bacterium]|nr:2-phospho-L-lactate transferase CofD family protein [Polyangiaceae bacterium]